MKKYHILKSIGLGAFCLGLTFTGFVQGEDKTSNDNLVANGDFEEWIPHQMAESPKTTETPTKWNEYLEQKSDDPSSKGKGAIFKDTAIKHGGQASMRIENELPTDITGVYQTFEIDPHTSYRVHCWVRGENIQLSSNGGIGVMVWANWGPEDFWGNQHPLAQSPPIKSGSFEWQEFTFTVNTSDGAAQMKVDLQLRHATGKLWYDDVEVIPQGKITPVKSF